MPVPSVITDLDPDPNDNFPIGSENVFPELDNYLRAHAAFIRQNYDNKVDLADLADTTNPANGAALVGFLQSGTGAVARTVQDKMREWVSVKDFGAVGDGVTDDTAAIQAFFNTVGLGKIGFIDSGDYLLTSVVTITLGPGGFVCTGAGVESVRFIAASTFSGATPVIKIVGSNSQPGFQLSGFSIRPSIGGFGAATVGLQVGSDSTGDPIIAGFNTSTIKNVFVADFPTCFKVVHARLVRFEDCAAWMTGYLSAGHCLLVEQSGLFTGDLLFDRCQFVSTRSSNRFGVLIRSNTGPYNPANGNGQVAGIKFRSCDFYSGSRAVSLYAGNQAWLTDVWFVDGCQIDQEVDYCVSVESNNANALIANIHFDGLYCNKSLSAALQLSSTGTGGIIRDAWIQNCEFISPQVSAINCFGSGVQNVYVKTNTIEDCPHNSGAIVFNGTTGLHCVGNRVRRGPMNVAPWYLVDLLSGTTDIFCTGNDGAGVTLVAVIRDLSGDVIKIITDNPGYNPRSQQPITVTASPFTYKNTSGAPEYVYVSGGTISNVTIGGAFGVVATTNNCWLVPQGQTITVTYTSAPTMFSLGL